MIWEHENIRIDLQIVQRQHKNDRNWSATAKFFAGGVEHTWYKSVGAISEITREEAYWAAKYYLKQHISELRESAFVERLRVKSAKLLQKLVDAGARTSRTKLTVNGKAAMQSGEIAELAVSLDLLEQGFEVYRALDRGSSVDLVARKSGGMLAIEVKRAPVSKTTGRVDCEVTNHGCFDVLAVVSPEGLIYYIPAAGVSKDRRPKVTEKHLGVLHERDVKVPQSGEEVESPAGESPKVHVSSHLQTNELVSRAGLGTVTCSQDL